jgi:hypothetical protein
VVGAALLLLALLLLALLVLALLLMLLLLRVLALPVSTPALLLYISMTPPPSPVSIRSSQFAGGSRGASPAELCCSARDLLPVAVPGPVPAPPPPRPAITNESPSRKLSMGSLW